MKFAIVIEKAEHNYSAYVPDLPGCITTGKTLAEIRRLMKEAIEFHIDSMQRDGETVPAPTTVCEYVQVDVPQPQGR
jgi:predicted RNase H-like HicB family nuclease